MRSYVQDDVFRSKHVVDAVATADGTIFYQLVETAGTKCADTERKRNTIWRLDPLGSQVEITGWAGDAFSLALAPDGRSILFLGSPDVRSVPQVFRFVAATGALTALTAVESGVISFAASPDGAHLALVATDPRARADAPKTHVRITCLAYRFDPAGGYIQDAPHALHIMPLGVVGEPKAISPFDGIISAVLWSPDGSRLAYVVHARAQSNRSALFGDLFVTDVEGERTALISGKFISSPIWTTDGSRIAYATYPDGDFSRQPQLWVVDCKSGAKQPRSGKLDRPVIGSVQINNPTASLRGRILRESDRAVIAPIVVGSELRVCRVALEGTETVETITSGACVAYPLFLSGTRLLISRQEALCPAELWAVDLVTGEQCALTDHNSAWQSEIAWPKIEQVNIESGGAIIESWILVPSGTTAPYPAILYIHGGPHAGFCHGFNEDFQELVGAGYAVVYANPHGSTGYGDDFARSICGRRGELEFEDFMKLLDELVRRGLIDPERLGVTGVSGGGHLTAWLMTHTNRFRAAVPEEGVYSMLSMYGVSDAGIDLTPVGMLGRPHEQPERYWNLSPIAHAHKCRTPALLIQGENDLRCPMEQAEQLYTILKVNGCETELLRLRDCNHVRELAGAPALRRVRMDAMKEWFSRFIR